MKKNILISLFFVLVFLTLPLIAQGKAHAAFLKFDNTSYTVNTDGTITVDVIVDPAGEKITSIDAYVEYDNGFLQAQSVTDGTYFPTVFNDISDDRVYIAGLVDDPSTFKEGVGTVASITFKAVKNGSTNLSYKCDATATETSKVIKNDFDATNIIVCSENGSATVTIGEGEVTATPEAAPQELPQSGTMDSLLRLGSTGAGLLIFGVALRFLL